MAKASELPTFNDGGNTTIGATTVAAGISGPSVGAAMVYVAPAGSVTMRLGSDTVGGLPLVSGAIYGPFQASNLSLLNFISGSGTVTVNLAYLK